MLVHDGKYSRWLPNTLLGRVDEHTRRALFAAGVEHRHEENRYLIRQDDPGRHAFLILSGMVKVLVHTSSGAPGLLGIRVAGEMVGEMAALDDLAPRSANIITSGDVAVHRIEGVRLRELMSAHPKLTLEMFRMIGWRLRWANRRRIEAGTYGPRVRVARLLGELAATYGMRQPNGHDLGVLLTQAELASLAGIAQRTAERELRSLEQDGVIVRHYRRLEVIAPGRLAEIAEWGKNPPPGVFL